MFVTYEGQTCTINKVKHNYTADITYVDSDGVDRSENVCIDSLEGFESGHIDWEKLHYEARVQVYDQYRDYEFTDGSPRRLICITYNSDTKDWYGNVYFSEEDQGSFDYADVALTPDEVERLVKYIPKKDLNPDLFTPEDVEHVYVVTHRWDQYMSMDIEVFSSFSDALVYFNSLASDYGDFHQYFDVNIFPTADECFGMLENTEEGTSVRLERVQKDLQVD
jgi:hypothetical protein